MSAKFVPRSRLEAFLRLPADAPVRVYTCQEPEALERLKQRGYLTGPNEENVDKDFQRAYDWMRVKMGERIEGYSGEYPVWAWLKRPPARMRNRKNDRSLLRIIALVPKKRILLSDYDRWHSVLNNSPCARTEEEFDNWIGDPRPSWDRVLDFTPWTSEAEKDWLGPSHRFLIQACIDRIHSHEIVSMRIFERRVRTR